MIAINLPHGQNQLPSAKGLVTELTPLLAQSAWGSREERVQATGLAACCNYLSKKKKKKYQLNQ